MGRLRWIKDPETQGVGFLVIGFSALSVMAYIFIDALLSGSIGDCPGWLFVAIGSFLFMIVLFLWYGFRKLREARHPDLYIREFVIRGNQVEEKGSRFVGVLFLLIGLFSLGLFLWSYFSGYLHNSKFAAFFMFVFGFVFFCIGVYMIRNKDLSISWRFHAELTVDFKGKTIYAYNRESLIGLCLFVMLLGSVILYVDYCLAIIKAGFLAVSLLFVVGGSFFAYGLATLVLAMRKDTKIIYSGANRISIASDGNQKKKSRESASMLVSTKKNKKRK